MSPFNYGADDPTSKPSVPKRPEPERQDASGVQPWFVEDATNKTNINEKAKTAVKRTSSILFPIIGLTVVIGILALTVFLVMDIYG